MVAKQAKHSARGKGRGHQHERTQRSADAVWTETLGNLFLMMGWLLEMVQKAYVLKEEGNGKCAQKQCVEVAASCKRAVDLFDCLPLTVRAREMLVVLCCNSAQAWLKVDCDEAAANRRRWQRRLFCTSQRV